MLLNKSAKTGFLRPWDDLIENDPYVSLIHKKGHQSEYMIRLLVSIGLGALILFGFTNFLNQISVNKEKAQFEQAKENLEYQINRINLENLQQGQK